MRADLIGLEVDPVAEEQHDTGLIERQSRPGGGRRARGAAALGPQNQGAPSAGMCSR